MTTARSHVEEIACVAMGRGSVRDAPVVQSWLRCLNDYRLDPGRAQEAYIVPASQLREHREQTQELIRIGRSALEGLFHHVMHQDYVLLLSDARGVTVDFMGDPTFDNELRHAGLYLGSEWSEQRAGTCAVGACIVSGEPVVIHQDDHFDVSHIGLTCTAAPIFDTLGDLTAVLDISQLRSPTVKASQRLALHLVTDTVRRIELAHLMMRARHDWILRLSRSPDFLDVDPEAAIAIDAAGCISGLTHGSLRALAPLLGGTLGPTRQLVGQPIASLLELGVDELPRLMRGRPGSERVVRTRAGVPLFASAMPPAARPATAARPEQLPTPVPQALRELACGDPAMDQVLQRAARLAPRDIPILIQGETGTGKEFLARAIHRSRPQPGPFVAVNCAAIPEALIESELFGYAANAFTGAAARGRVGLIASADGGTLFLDEIGDMPLALQARLLRVLAEGEVTPVGAQRPHPVRFRLLSASHHRLESLVADGRFRQDLYFRLNAATLSLPPLRERRDLAALAERLLVRLASEEGRTLRLSPAVSEALRAYAWPGNLRELVNVLRVAVALADGEEIDVANLPAGMQPGRRGMPPGNPPAAGTVDQADPHLVLLQQLADCAGNVSELARRLGVDRSTVHRRLRRGRRSAGSLRPA